MNTSPSVSLLAMFTSLSSGPEIMKGLLQDFGLMGHIRTSHCGHSGFSKQQDTSLLFSFNFDNK